MSEQDASDTDTDRDETAANTEADAENATDGAAEQSSDGDETGVSDDDPAGGADQADAGEPQATTVPLADVDLDDTEAPEPSFSDVDVDEALIERVETSDAESIATELAMLRDRVETLEQQLADRDAELEEVTGKLKRKQADFQNYKKRMEKRRDQERQRATEDLVERLTSVRDNLVRALDQDESADIRGGVEATLRRFDDVLAEENVEVIDPEPGTETDPHRHEVLARIDADVPAGRIAEVHRQGYEMAGSVIRAAQVTVSEPTDDASDEPAEADGSASDDTDDADESPDESATENDDER